MPTDSCSDSSWVRNVWKVAVSWPSFQTQLNPSGMNRRPRAQELLSPNAETDSPYLDVLVRGCVPQGLDRASGRIEPERQVHRSARTFGRERQRALSRGN